MRIWKNLVWAALAASVSGVVTASCGGGTRNLCADRNITCDAPLACDPSDGVCKCGGRGGVVCPSGFVCDPVANTCQSTKCARVDCSDKFGTSCDVLDGQCKCGGTGGQVCAANEQCQPLTKVCAPSIDCRAAGCKRFETCEQATGKCLCGSSTCLRDQACSVAPSGGARVCTTTACLGVTCTGSNVCDSADGLCKCNGVVCQSGEACACPAGSDGGVCDASQRSCRAGSACFGLPMCQNGTTCDPVDGICKCAGPGGPICSSNQICSLTPTPKCQGGQQCTNADGGTKTCPSGTSCDPEDGICKCGGRGGSVCAPASADGGTELAEVCVQNPNQQACRRPCDIRSPDCPTGQYCYFDSSATTPVSYCAVPTGNRTEFIEPSCESPTSCFSMTPAPRSLHCNGLALGQRGLCKAYCDVAAGPAGCLQVPMAQRCLQITGAPMNYGYCTP